MWQKDQNKVPFDPHLDESVFFTNWERAIEICKGYKLGGYKDWRLPNSNELRSLIRGCPETVTGGACSSECFISECDNYEPCSGCNESKGPSEGCYWPINLEGYCNLYWSSTSKNNSQYSNYAFVIDFRTGKISGGDKNAYHDHTHWRCVRDLD